MPWLTALVKAILEWITGEVKKDTKASDADATPRSLKDRWRKRIDTQLEKDKSDYYQFESLPGNSVLRLREEKKARKLGYEPNEKGEWVKNEES